MATEAQTLANRANALKSTGPRTREGKDLARRNAMKHGLCAETLLLPEDEEDAIAVRLARLAELPGTRRRIRAHPRGAVRRLLGATQALPGERGRAADQAGHPRRALLGRRQARRGRRGRQIAGEIPHCRRSTR